MFAAVQKALGCLSRSDLYRARRRVGLSAIGLLWAALTTILIGTGIGGCSVSRNDAAFAQMQATTVSEVTGSIAPPARPAQSADSTPSESDLAFVRNAASDVLTQGNKDSSQPWENPASGARGSVTPVAAAYVSDARNCRDFLASFVSGRSERWLQGSACQTEHGSWEIHTLKPWTRS